MFSESTSWLLLLPLPLPLVEVWCLTVSGNTTNACLSLHQRHFCLQPVSTHTQYKSENIWSAWLGVRVFKHPLPPAAIS